jgi:hypothetical protein
MAYRNRVFVSFDGDKDIHFYRLMLAWKQSDYSSFSFNDAHEYKQARDTSQEETIKRSLRDRFLNSRVFVLLVGESTRYLYKFVRWEIEQAISLGLPIVVTNLNGLRWMDSERCPPLLQQSLAIHVAFGSKILEHALENWPNEHALRTSRGEKGPYYYSDSVYSRIGA